MNSEYLGKMRVVLFTCVALLAFFVSGCGEPSDPEKRTAESLTMLADGVYIADCYTDHKLDEYLAANIRDVDSFDAWMTENLTHGVSTGEVPDTGCASFSVTDHTGDHLFGRNYDMPVKADSMIVRCYPENGYASIGIVDMMHLNLGKGCDHDVDDEACRSLLFAAPWCICDGINEKGLGVSLLELQNEHVVYDTSRPDLLLYSAARVILDKCATADDAVALLDGYDVYSPRSNSYHLFITDLSGQSFILEWIDGELCVVRGNAVTNFLLSNGSSDPDQRRTKIERSLDSSDRMNSEEAMAVLELVNRQTRWSAVYDLERFSVDVCFNADYSDTIRCFGKKTETTDNTADLIYDDTDNTWSSQEEEYQPLVGVMKRECTKSPEIKGTYILATDDRIVFIGGINAEDLSGRKVDAFTTYEIGSITKMFTATAILQLCEQGKLSLDDTLDKFFPEFEYGKGITVYQLLHMQSGLRKDFVTEETFLLENGERDYEEWKRYFYDGFTDDELLNMVFDDELLFEPGTQYLYSNVGYSLLAMIMEKITGQSYGDYVQKNIFDVCGMEHTSSMKTGDVTSVPEYVPGDDASDEDPYQYVDTLYMQLIKPERGVGDIHSCAYDLLLFDRALIGGKLIGGDSLAEMFCMDKGYGCGWMQYGPQAHPVDGVYWHGGETWVYKGYNVYCKTEEYGNIYLIQLHPTTAGDEYSLECIQNVVTFME